MSVRSVLGIAVAAFLVVGFVGWIGNMPHPTDLDGDTAVEALPVVPAVQQSQTSGVGTTSVAATSVIDPGWLQRTSAATGIPSRALQGYALAARTVAAEKPGCKLGWNTIAAIGEAESAHGSHDGASIAADGTVVGSIIGPRLDGHGYAAVTDTDQGRWDGDAEWDHAVGPLQFLPATWAGTGRDATGDGIADPNNIDDAALTAATYLCAGGGDLTTAAGWAAAVLSYNHDDAYLATVRATSADYATQAAG